MLAYINMNRKVIVIALSTMLAAVTIMMLVIDYDVVVDVVREKYHQESETFGHMSPPPSDKIAPPPPEPLANIETNSIRISQVKTKGMVILPKAFPNKDLYTKLNPAASVVHYQNYSSDPLNNIDLEPARFHSHEFITFSKTRNTINVDVSAMSPMDDDITPIIQQFVNSDSPMFREIYPYIKDDIDLQIANGEINKHWYKLAGTSVWLEQYGVHFMISRIVYSSSGVRNIPQFSLTYAQVFDETWAELEEVSLVVPSTFPHHDLIVGDTPFATLKYPQVLPVPTLHDPHHSHRRYYGPEDPRLLLVKNNGYEEPLIVFNAHHGKITQKVRTNEFDENLHWEYYRSMFVCWPWQFQQGKRNIQELADDTTDHVTYLKVLELRRDGLPRVAIQKNWTPFIDFEERTQLGYDKYIYFVYRWSDLEILKCELQQDTSKCNFIYRMNKELDGEAPVGPLRGGTEMINVNSLVHDSGLSNRLQLPSGYQIWIGFARAHLKDCGCGKTMYRPNLVVIVKDGSNQYKIELISSFVSLDVTMIGWDLDHPQQVCTEHGQSVFIPNGISSWSIRDFDDATNDFNDYMTLTFSLSDVTIDSIQLKGVLKQVLAVLAPEEGGYDNQNVDAALEESTAFCQEFGKTHQDPKL